MMSAVTANDRWGNYWLAKERATQKIDCAIALAMAVGAALSYDGADMGAALSRAILERSGFA
jgi:hypothetical protein